ncbi:MAG TPA: hypothetical protein VGN26_23740 [Armatimonadota bacterium]
MAKLGYEQERLSSRLIALDARNSSLRVQIEMLRSPERIRAWALHSGMVESHKEQYVRVGRGPDVARLPRPIGDARPLLTQ